MAGWLAQQHKEILCMWVWVRMCLCLSVCVWVRLMMFRKNLLCSIIMMQKLSVCVFPSLADCYFLIAQKMGVLTCRITLIFTSPCLCVSHIQYSIWQSVCYSVCVWRGSDRLVGRFVCVGGTSRLSTDRQSFPALTKSSCFWGVSGGALCPNLLDLKAPPFSIFLS